MADLFTLIGKKYDLIQELGRGGMGVVYLATQKSLNRTVALKIVPPTYFVNSTLRERFQREVQIMRKLSHPSIVSIYECEQLEDGSSVIVMEYMKGSSLDDILHQGAVKDWRKVAHWGSRVADALYHAHQKGIVHRDIKPGNVMLLENDVVKVMDFGIAKSEGSSNLTMDKIIGTPTYMSPEQALGRAVDHRADIYSLGMMLYALLAGRAPFDRGDQTHQLEIIRMQISESPEFLGSKVPGLPEKLVSLIHQMISKSPIDRPVDCDDIRKKLEDLVSNKVKKEFFVTQIMAEIGGLGNRLKRDRLKPTDFLILEFALPGLSKILSHQMGLGLFIALLSGGMIFTPYPITLSIVFRIVSALWTFFSLKGSDGRAAFDYLWHYQRFPFMVISLLLAVAVFGSFIFETDRNFGVKIVAPRIIADVPKGADGQEQPAGFGNPDRAGAVEPTPAAVSNDHGLTVAESPVVTDIPTPAPIGSPVPAATVAEQEGPTDVASLPPSPTPEPTPRPTRRPSALDMLGDVDSRSIINTMAPPQASPAPSPKVAVKPMAEYSDDELLKLSENAIRERDMTRLEQLLAFLNKEKREAGNEYLVMRYLLSNAFSWLDSPAYTRNVREGWAYVDDDYLLVRSRVAADKSPATQEALVRLLLAQSFNVSLNVTKRKNLVELVDPSYGRSQIEDALRSEDLDRNFAALLLISDENRPELTPAVLRFLDIRGTAKALRDAFYESSLSWLERHGSKDALPVLEEKVKRSDVLLGDKRRIQEAIQRIQSRSGG